MLHFPAEERALRPTISFASNDHAPIGALPASSCGQLGSASWLFPYNDNWPWRKAVDVHQLLQQRIIVSLQMCDPLLKMFLCLIEGLPFRIPSPLLDQTVSFLQTRYLGA
jgi:hypothetical protein